MQRLLEWGGANIAQNISKAVSASRKSDSKGLTIIFSLMKIQIVLKIWHVIVNLFVYAMIIFF